jgi:hypothetical protein
MASENHANDHGCRLLEADLVRLVAADQEQVDGEHRQHEADERRPHPGLADMHGGVHVLPWPA